LKMVINGKKNCLTTLSQTNLLDNDP